MLKAVNMNGKRPPMKRPMITFGSLSENSKYERQEAPKCARNSST